MFKADYAEEPWELYDLSLDWSECDNLADKNQSKLTELQHLWWEEADKHGVLPLDDRMFELLVSGLHQSPSPFRPKVCV